MSSNWQIFAFCTPILHFDEFLENFWFWTDFRLFKSSHRYQTQANRYWSTVWQCTCVHAFDNQRKWTQHIQTSISSSCPPLGPVPSPCSLPYMTSQPSSTTSPLDSLPKTEIFWRDNFTWFKDQGYQLRPRFAPDWIPSWLGTSKFRLRCEDGHPLLVSFLGNAHRNILISMFPVRSSQWCLAYPYGVACCIKKTIQGRSSIWGGHRALFIVGSALERFT